MVEVPGQEVDPGLPFEPARPVRVADEGEDLGPGLFEQPFDEVAPEEARAPGDQDAHDPDSMRNGSGGQ
jgi:hypothetical protein